MTSLEDIREDNWASLLPGDKTGESLKLIYIIPEKEGDENNLSEFKSSLSVSRSTIRNWTDDLMDEGFVEKKEGRKTKLYLTDKGRRLRDIIKPLFLDAEMVRKEIEKFKTKYLRYPDREELSKRIGREVEDNEVSYQEPDEKTKKAAEDKLTKVVNQALIIYTSDDKTYYEDNSRFEEGWEYYQENKDLMEKFENRSGYGYEVPDKLKPYVNEAYMSSTTLDSP